MVIYREIYPNGSHEDVTIEPRDWVVDVKRCTYFKDRNGVLLFEGDYIRGHEGTDQPVDGHITWDDRQGCWRVGKGILWKHHAASCRISNPMDKAVITHNGKVVALQG